jgi:50S ribosome-binding GTPase
MSARRQASPDRAGAGGEVPQARGAEADAASDDEQATAQQATDAGDAGTESAGRATGPGQQSIEEASQAVPGQVRGRRVPASSSRDKLPTRVPVSQQRRGRPGLGRDGSMGGPQASPGPLPPGWAGQGGDDQRAPSGLSARLMALARMIQIGSARSGRNGFSKKALADAEDVLGRAGERMRLSSAHTIVVLGGGTGSGKSSLFNRLAGADFSTVGVIRPVTRDAHACIWGATGSGALLEWLGVPARNRYSRASALDRGEQDLAGLVLLDLPDHDSVMGHAGDAVNRHVSLADVMIWVLDPQKYADAAVHRRFLVPMAGHSEVLAVVLNQSDLLTQEQVDDCVADLRRLLDSENLPDVPIMVTSAVTGAGVDDLRNLLLDGVAARRAATARISADVDGIVSRFVQYAGDPTLGVSAIPGPASDQLVDRLAVAAGLDAMSDSLRSASELRAADYVGWPVAWFLQRVTGRNPMRKVKLGALWNELRSISAGPAGAQQAETDNALTEFGDTIADALPAPWSQTVRAAARSRADGLPPAIGSAIGDALPAEDRITWWWRIVGTGQGLLLGAVVVAVGWMIVIAVFGVFHAGAGVPAAFTDTATLAWLGAGAVVALGLGAAMAATSMSRVGKAAAYANARVVADVRERIATLASEMVIMPARQELSEFERYREELRIAERGMAFAGQRVGEAADEHASESAGDGAGGDEAAARLPARPADEPASAT